MSSIPDLLLRTMGLVNPLIHEVVEMLYEFNQPFVVDSSKFVHAFGDIATPHHEAVRQTWSGIAYKREPKPPSG